MNQSRGRCLNSPLDRKKWDDQSGRDGAILFVALGALFFWLTFALVPPTQWLWRIGLGYLGCAWFFLAWALFGMWRRTYRERSAVFIGAQPVRMRLNIAGSDTANYQLEVRAGKRPTARFWFGVADKVLLIFDLLSLSSGRTTVMMKSYVCTGYLFLQDEEQHDSGQWAKEASHTVKLDLPDKVALAIKTEGVLVDVYLQPATRKPFAFVLDDELFYPLP